jgi:hypothetical protein
MKTPSHRNLLIALGVAVAVIILFTAIYFKDNTLTLNNPFSGKSPALKKASEVTIDRFSKRIIPLLQYLKKSASF